MGNMFENTIAMSRIIASGLLDKHPKLKLVCPISEAPYPISLAEWITR